MTNTNEHAWIKHYPKGIDWHAAINIQPIDKLLENSAQKSPQNICLEFKGREFTYAEINDKVTRVSHALQQMGIGRNSRVGLFLPNCPQFVIAYYAILRAGATVVNYNPLYSPRELEHQIRDSETEIMFTLDLKLLYDKLSPLLEKTPLRRIIVSSMGDALSWSKSILFNLTRSKDIANFSHDAEHLSFSTLLEAPAIAPEVTINPEQDIAVLQYTGGTTGVPKGVILTHANLSANVEQAKLWLNAQSDSNAVETMVGILPFFHVFAMTVVMNLGIATRMRLLLHPKLELKSLLEEIQNKRPTFMPGVPTLFSALLNYKKLADYNLSSLKTCISGGAPLPVEIKQRFEELTGSTLIEGYGMSESSPIVAANPLHGINKSGSIGLPLPQTILEIIDPETGNILPTGEIGEICIRGPQIMSGYWNNQTETDNVLKNGRLHSGDLGKMDEDGYFYVVDRLKEMIISGGYNIYPRNIEEQIYQHEEILEAAVVGRNNKLRGQEPVAFVVRKAGSNLNETQLKEFLKARLSSYTLPAEIIFCDDLPKSIIGKILKKDLLDLLRN